MKEIKPKRRRKRFGGLQIFILLELVIIGVLGLVFYKIEEEASRPEAVLEQFCTALKDKEWNKVYTYFNIPHKDAQLTQQMFINAKRYDTDKDRYCSYTYEASDEEVELSVYENQYGPYLDTKYYIISFQKSDGSEDTKLGINLVKTGKKYFFFDKWQVSPAKFLVTNTGFTLQKGATMKLNETDIALDQRSDGKLVSFGIPYLFKGSYQLEVAMDGMLTYRDNLSIKKSDQTYMISLSVDTNGTEELLLKAEQDIDKIVNASLTDEGFGIVSDLFATEALENGNIQNAYNEVRKIASSGGIGVTWLEVSNLQGSVQVISDSNETDLDGNIEVVLSGIAKEKYIEVDAETFGLKNSEKEFDIKFVMIYTKTNGQWKLMNMPVTAELLQ